MSVECVGPRGVDVSGQRREQTRDVGRTAGAAVPFLPDRVDACVVLCRWGIYGQGIGVEKAPAVQRHAAQVPVVQHAFHDVGILAATLDLKHAVRKKNESYPYKINEEGGKYINSPNHLLYNKSKILYGLNFAKEEIKSKKEAILVEGYFDVLLSWQEGTKNVVAPCGTSFGESHMRLLKRFTQNLIFSFDMDDAGIKAAKRSTILAQKEGFKVKVLPLPPGKDPADVIKEEKNEWQKALSGKKEGVLFFYELSLKRWNKESFSGKREILSFFLPILSSIKDKIEIQEWIQKLSFDLKIKEEILWEKVNELKKEIEKEKKVFERYEEKEIFVKTFSQKDLIEERLLCIVAFEKDLREKFKDSLLKLISHPERKKIIISLLEEGKIPEEFSQKAKEMKLQYEIEKEKGINFEKEVPFLLERLKKIYIKEKLEKLQEKLKEAEAKKDFSEVKKILSQIENAKKEI